MPDSIANVEVQHAWDAKSHAYAQRAVWRYTKVGRWLRAFAYVTIAVAGILMLGLWVGTEGSVRHRLLAALPWLVVAGLWVMLLRGGFPWLSRFSARQSMVDPNQPLIDTVSAAGYSRRQSGSEFRVPWQDIKRVVETPQLFLFFHTANCAYYIPKTALSDMQQQAVRAIVRERMAPERVVIESTVAA
jgi:hypothetical protein